MIWLTRWITPKPYASLMSTLCWQTITRSMTLTPIWSSAPWPLAEKRSVIFPIGRTKRQAGVRRPCRYWMCSISKDPKTCRIPTLMTLLMNSVTVCWPKQRLSGWPLPKTVPMPMTSRKSFWRTLMRITHNWHWTSIYKTSARNCVRATKMKVTSRL